MVPPTFRKGFLCLFLETFSQMHPYVYLVRDSRLSQNDRQNTSIISEDDELSKFIFRFY